MVARGSGAFPEPERRGLRRGQFHVVSVCTDDLSAFGLSRAISSCCVGTFTRGEDRSVLCVNIAQQVPEIQRGYFFQLSSFASQLQAMKDSCGRRKGGFFVCFFRSASLESHSGCFIPSCVFPGKSSHQSCHFGILRMLSAKSREIWPDCPCVCERCSL